MLLKTLKRMILLEKMYSINYITYSEFQYGTKMSIDQYLKEINNNNGDSDIRQRERD
jgi:hypothetical protein